LPKSPPHGGRHATIARLVWEGIRENKGIGSGGEDLFQDPDREEKAAFTASWISETAVKPVAPMPDPAPFSPRGSMSSRGPITLSKLEGGRLKGRLRRFQNPEIDYAARHLCEEVNEMKPVTLDKYRFPLHFRVS
jgi:hypothetical protein